MSTNLPASNDFKRAQELADEAKTLVPSAERLAEIVRELRADDLYRLLGFDTWEAFCTDYLGVSKWTANRMIAPPKPKSITAGDGVAAVQSAPKVERDRLKSGGTPDASPTAPPAVESDQSGRPADTRGAGSPDSGSAMHGGAETTGDGRCEELADALTPRPTGAVNPPEPRNPERLPSLRQIASEWFANLQNTEEGFAVRLTAEEVTYANRRMDLEFAAWAEEHRISATPDAEPKRRQGYKTTPEDRAKAKLEAVPTDPCDHPKAKLKKLTWGTVCDGCGKRVA